jgi:two-component system CheB/CheR fusion protein
MEQTKSVILPTLLKVTGRVCTSGMDCRLLNRRRGILLAIAFKEVLESTGKHRNLTLQIFATDLDTDAIEKHAAVSSLNIVVDVSPERISKFFNIEAGGYRVFIREMLIFAPIMSSKILLLLN